jgi:hypothetical protein
MEIPLSAHRPTIGDNRANRVVPLLSHAHLPHCRERDKSAEVAVTHQPKVCNPSAEGLLVTCQPNLHTEFGRTALYLCSITLISLMAGECRVGTEVAVANVPKVCRMAAEGLLSSISRTYTRNWLRDRDSNPEPCG